MDPDAVLLMAMEHMHWSWEFGEETGLYPEPTTMEGYTGPSEEDKREMEERDYMEERMNAAECLYALAKWLEMGGFPPTVVRREFRGREGYFVPERILD